MQRTAINPWPWSLMFGFSQGERIEAPARLLFCAGQTALDAGGRVMHEGDMEAQLRLALDNLETVLQAADMNLGNVARLVIYTTDMDRLLPHMGMLGARLGIAPAETLLGVSRLALPGLMVELEATAVA